MNEFKLTHTFEQRHAEAMNILEKYPQRVPVIVEMSKVCKSKISLDKKKYLIPLDLTMGQFVYIIRKRMNLSPDRALYLLINNILPPNVSSIADIYHLHKDDDGFLYVVYTDESTFG